MSPKLVRTHPLIRPVVPGCAGCAMAHPYFADQLTLFQPGGTDYAHLIITGIPRFSVALFRKEKENTQNLYCAVHYVLPERNSYQVL